MTDLDQLRDDLLAAVAAAAGLDALEAVRVHALGKQGAVTGAAQDAGRHDARGASGAGPAHPRPARGGHRRDRGAQGAARARRARRAAGARDARHDAAGRRGADGHGPSGQPGDGRTGRDLRRSRLRGRDRARDRGRLAQFHRAQHSRDPSGAGDARHLLFPGRRGRRAQDAAAHAHLAGADPHDGERRSRRSASSRRAAPIAPIRTRPTRRCSIRSRGW